MIFSLLIRQRKIRNVRSFDTKEIIKYSSNFLGPESYTRRTSEWLIKLIIQHNHVLFFGRVPHLMWWCLMLKMKCSLVKMDLVKHVHQSWWENPDLWAIICHWKWFDAVNFAKVNVSSQNFIHFTDVFIWHYIEIVMKANPFFRLEKVISMSFYWWIEFTCLCHMRLFAINRCR